MRYLRIMLVSQGSYIIRLHSLPCARMTFSAIGISTVGGHIEHGVADSQIWLGRVIVRRILTGIVFSPSLSFYLYLFVSIKGLYKVLRFTQYKVFV